MLFSFLKKMSVNNYPIQNYSNNNFSNNNQNKSNPLILRQGFKEMQININPEVFQISILNSINNFRNNDLNNLNNQNKIQVWQQFGKELQDMSNHLKETFQVVMKILLIYDKNVNRPIQKSKNIRIIIFFVFPRLIVTLKKIFLFVNFISILEYF